ncbi:outer membrane beta-barrel protein [Cellvibrio sp. NN19]|uniref:outer membrane beta-barrel protein n=1 Tax=Cellvibrio chitinivorans TaxID=3102792 RepID=UPI002B40B785|nr:outer membrane beta-barrel protein [Cellvibrio sp. NN19]
MKKLIATSLLLALGGAPMVSWAGSDTGLYVGGSIGQTSVESDDIGGFNLKDDDNGYKLFFGYNFGVLPLLDLAVEADYREYGKFGGNGVNTEVTSSELFGLVGLNFGLIGVFGKIGYSDTDLDSVLDTSVGDIKGNDSENATAWGVGAKLKFTSFALRAEYEALELDNVDDLYMISVGASYTF